MTRRQAEIPGTERTEHPEVEKAAAAYCTVRDERAELSKREAQKKLELLAVMRANNLTVYKFYDDQGEELVARVDDGDPKVSVKRTGEAESEIGTGISDVSDDGPRPGLIAEALKAQQDSGVGESDDGDVVVPDTAAPKKSKRKGSKKS